TPQPCKDGTLATHYPSAYAVNPALELPGHFNQVEYPLHSGNSSSIQNVERTPVRGRWQMIEDLCAILRSNLIEPPTHTIREFSNLTFAFRRNGNRRRGAAAPEPAVQVMNKPPSAW